MRITKVYTRGGDSGNTSLVGGARVRKDHPRIEAYGTVDELNAIVGLVRTFNARSDADPDRIAELDRMLHTIQNDLFNLGSDLATPADKRWEGMYRVGDDDVARLEGWIDHLNAELGPLKEFILPGGGPVGAFFHQARTVCRRAERDTIRLMEQSEDVGLGPMRYLNRLSDYLFVAGRWAAKSLGEPEYLWERPGQR
ncbi:MAG: cob(I)yrinic acid a,c-diamide adenosyltransferase [Alphaproteobacteria bacterium]|nr:cob(I)yrinic acid a,c-diamide adenosyltransferase [Alphaproteobacteria bacterium]